MERINATTGSYNFIDLFAGAGGLSEGFIQAGFSPVAHVEMNPYAAQTLETRTGYYYLKAQGKLDIYKDCAMILFDNVGAQPAASFLLKFASFAKFLKQPERLCCSCTDQIFNFFSCNTAIFPCILKNE